MEFKKPLLGICLGSQLIAHVLGCEIKSTGKLNIGYDVKIFEYTNIFRSHIDYIIPNDSIIVIEYFENMPYLYRHQNHVYGIQCHPDITPEYVQTHTNHIESVEYSKKNTQTINKNNLEIINILLDFLKN